MNLSRAYFNPLNKSNISYGNNIFKLLAKIINCSVLKGAHCQLRPATLYRDRLKGVQILLSNSQAGPDRQIPVLNFSHLPPSCGWISQVEKSKSRLFPFAAGAGQVGKNKNLYLSPFPPVQTLQAFPHLPCFYMFPSDREPFGPPPR